MRVLFDLNVVLDLLLDREPWSMDAKALAARVLDGRLGGFICASSMPTLYYLVNRNAGRQRARRAVQLTLQAFDFVLVGRSTLELAASSAGADFEDNVQIASAVEAGMDAIVTRDATGFGHSGVRIVSPSNLEAE